MEENLIVDEAIMTMEDAEVEIEFGEGNIRIDGELTEEK